MARSSASRRLGILVVCAFIPVGWAQGTPICGDCDGSGRVDVLDAVQVAMVSAGLATMPSPGFEACNVAGVPGSAPAGVLTILDAYAIASYVVGLVFPLSCSATPSCDMTTPTGVSSGDVAISWSGIDAFGAPMDIAVWWSSDGGATWVSAVEGAGGDGTIALSTSLPPGDPHTYVWDSASSGAGSGGLQSVLLRIDVLAAGGGTASSCTTTGFDVDNSAPACCAVTCRAGQVEGGSREQPAGIAHDAVGNAWIAGTFGGVNVDFDPGPGSWLMSVNPGWNGYVQKLDQAGDLVWAGQLGAGDQARIKGMALDPNTGDIWLTGSFEGNPLPGADFDPGGGTAFLASRQTSFWDDAFVAKLDSNGNFLWAGAFIDVATPSTIGENVGRSIAVDPLTGDVWIVGTFNGTVDFDPSPGGSYDLVSAGGEDIFVVKLHPNGDFVWAERFGDSALTTGEHPSLVEVDTGGDGWIAGTYTGNPTDFDPGPGVAVLDTQRGFLLRLRGDGTFVSAFAFGGRGSAAAITAVHHHSDGSLWIRGQSSSIGVDPTTIDFDPGPAVVNSTSPNSMYVLNLTPGGVFQWVREFQGIASPPLPALVEEPGTGSVWTGCQFGPFAHDFDPGPGVVTRAPVGSTDLALLRLDINGDYLCASHMGTTESDEFSDISLSTDGSIWVSAEIASATFPAGNNMQLCSADPPIWMNAVGDYDAVIIQTCPVVPPFSQPVCNITGPAPQSDVSGSSALLSVDVDDADADPLSITWLYDLGFGYVPCTAGIGSSNPQTGVTPGMVVDFAWDSLADSPGTTPGVRLRVIVSDGTLNTACDLSVNVINGAPLDGQIYVACFSPDTIVVIDQATMTQNTVIPTGAGPHGLRFHADRSKLWVVLRTAGALAAIDPVAESVVQTVGLGASSAVSVAVHPAGTHAYTGGISRAYRVDTSTYVSDSLMLSAPGGGPAPDPAGVGVLPDGSYVVTASPTGGFIHRMAPSLTGDTRFLPAPAAAPYWVATHPTLSDRVYITLQATDELLVWNPQTGATITTQPLSGTTPYACEVTPDGVLLFVCNRSSDSVDVFDTATSTLVQTIALPASTWPWGVAFSDDSGLAYVSGSGSGEVVEINLTSMAPTGRIALIGPSASLRGIAFE